MAKKNGRFITIVKRRSGFRFPADPHIIEVVVTAAASVPASSTSATARWIT
jgi:hypothetical protein